VERRTKVNSQNVGVAARHDLFNKKAYRASILPHNHRLELTAALRETVRPRSSA
jgi:hypothetical protein